MIDKIHSRYGLPFPVFPEGEVWLAGAGPGDPGLLTLHAVNAIEQADIIFYDALLDQSCLDCAKAGAVLEFAGKRGGFPSPKQHEITKCMIASAHDKLRVLRLKGGDPFIFGRGGDEVLALAQAHIPFRVIPGVTAGIAGPTYAGIPVTSRLINQSVTFITGHDIHGKLPRNLDWQALAHGSGVLVFYMAMKHFREIAEALLAAGRDPDDPVAFISNATTRKQRVITAELSHAAAAAREKGVKAPAVIVIGKVVNMMRALGHFRQEWKTILRSEIQDDKEAGHTSVSAEIENALPCKPEIAGKLS
ncbi:MAG: uroporphyrin-III C-methyltransferase [Candidatus Tokpelaia sp. JSC189]|nr:MAG: uroporphyrin-III C-methyltransferase [Candidatus Tokpelaia sp. JSC189]